MPSLATSVFGLLAIAAAGVAATSQLPNVIFRDVAIIGGGASGAYAAVRLRDDYNKSIALVEKRDRLVSTPHTIPGAHCTQ